MVDTQKIIYYAKEYVNEPQIHEVIEITNIKLNEPNEFIHMDLTYNGEYIHHIKLYENEDGRLKWSLEPYGDYTYEPDYMGAEDFSLLIHAMVEHHLFHEKRRNIADRVPKTGA